MTLPAATAVVHAHFEASAAASTRFFAAEASRIAACCRCLAGRFRSSGTLWVAGEGAQASDARHVAVEFVHPILVGKRALPAVALTGPAGDAAAAARLHALAGPGDILLALAAGTATPALREELAAARRRGLQTVLVAGRPPIPEACDLAFIVDNGDALIVQEVSETLYHVIWELVHVFIDAGARERGSYLVSAPHAAPDAEALIAQVAASTRQKAEEIAGLRRAVVARYESDIVTAGERLAARVSRGGRLLTFGNGGSATDAEDAATDAMSPPRGRWRAIPALSLVDDVGIVTAVANDVGVEHVFARQVEAFGRPGDVALAFSTSGASRNILAGMAAARSRGLLTIAMSGGDGGPLARPGEVDFCFTAPSDHLPRIQEAHATTWHALLAVVQERLR